MKSSSFFFFFSFLLFPFSKKIHNKQKKKQKKQNTKENKKETNKKNIILLVFAQSVGSSFFFPHSLFFDSILSSFLHPPQDPWSLLFLSKSQVCFVVFCVCFFVCVFFYMFAFCNSLEAQTPSSLSPTKPIPPTESQSPVISTVSCSLWTRKRRLPVPVGNSSPAPNITQNP